MNVSRRTVLLGGVGLGALGATSVKEAYGYKLTSHQHLLPGLRTPLRAVQLTDLHYGPFIRAASLNNWVDTTLALRPDVVLITGDFVDRHLLDSTAPLLQTLSRLTAPLGVWGVWGNHDYDYFGSEARRLGTPLPVTRETFRTALEGVGIRILRNAGTALREDLYLAGVDDLSRGDTQVQQALTQMPTTGAVLLMSHNPDVLENVPQQVTLTVCGHTHGGQVRLPFLGPLKSSSQLGFTEGWVFGPAAGYVSRGLGVTGAPVRLNCPAELVVFNFEPE
ncbi:metallophosphoesterase [Deinococcus sp. QL22]|uniref:metallophosphoesterase n=1 Tax=Deinococcus sp. QL22 TaxID=2939437 RepID=UPI0020174A24|nr:metallophosphoesterase [Deinococcus sp. QL22]UQN05434.1 metallophosphoesterase [Deinococcus sp. QL22]